MFYLKLIFLCDFLDHEIQPSFFAFPEILIVSFSYSH